MPITSRSRALAAPPAAVWKVVADPHHLPRWWPRVERVEAVARKHWTEVLRTDKGRLVRMDQQLEASETERLRRWAQRIDGTPFARVLRESVTEVRLERQDGGTLVTLELQRKLRGVSRFGGFMFRRAGRQHLDRALDSLETLV